MSLPDVIYVPFTSDNEGTREQLRDILTLQGWNYQGRAALRDSLDEEISVFVLSRNRVVEKWTGEWPKERGFYWFYGWRSAWAVKNLSPDIRLVEVKGLGSSTCYIAEGNFLYEKEGGKGKWLKAELPDTPVLEEYDG